MLTLLKQHLSSPGQYLNDSYRRVAIIQCFPNSSKGSGRSEILLGGGKGGKFFNQVRGT